MEAAAALAMRPSPAAPGSAAGSPGAALGSSAAGAGAIGAATQTSASVALSRSTALTASTAARRSGAAADSGSDWTTVRPETLSLTQISATPEPKKIPNDARASALLERALDRRAPVDVVADDVCLHLEPRRLELAPHARQRLGGDRSRRLGDHQHHAPGRLGSGSGARGQPRQQRPRARCTKGPQRGARQLHYFSMSLAASAYEPDGNRCRYSSASMPADDDPRRLSINILRPSACAA